MIKPAASVVAHISDQLYYSPFHSHWAYEWNEVEILCFYIGQ